jgi:hypothetical protein
MADVVVNISEGLNRVVGSELNRPETKVLLREAVEEKLKLLLLFKVTDDILKKSKLTDEGFEELVKEYKESIARRYGVV